MQDSISTSSPVEADLFEIFEWCSTDLISGFFEVLAKNGGTYMLNRVDLQMVEMIFPLNGKSPVEALCPLFKRGYIPVDCSLFVQIVLQMNLGLKHLTLSVGLLATINIDMHSKLSHRTVSLIRAENDELHAILSKTACNDKAQWVLSMGNDQYVGMTATGPQMKSATEWKTFIAAAIQSYQSFTSPFRMGPNGEFIQRPREIQQQMDQCRIGIWMAQNQLNRITPEMFVLEVATADSRIRDCWLNPESVQAENRAVRMADHQSSTPCGFGMSYPSAMWWTNDIKIREIGEQPLTAKEIIEKEQ